jgi:DNA gyrase subunit A
MMISDAGIVIRLRASDISVLGRDTQGVIIMRLNDGVVSTVASVPHEDDEEVAEVENATEETTEETSSDATPTETVAE